MAYLKQNLTTCLILISSIRSAFHIGSPGKKKTGAFFRWNMCVIKGECRAVVTVATYSIIGFCATFYKQKYCEILLRLAGRIVITIVTVCGLSMHLKIMLMLYIATRRAYILNFIAVLSSTHTHTMYTS